MGDGSFDGSGRGKGRVTLHTNNFTLNEVKLLQSILLSKFNLKSGLQKVSHSDPIRGYAIRIPAPLRSPIEDDRRLAQSRYSTINCFSSYLF